MILMSNTLMAIGYVLGALLDIYFWVVLISAILTWVRPDPYNVIVRTLRSLTEPVYYRIRKALPFVYTSGIDFSPLVVMIAIQLVNQIVVTSLLQYAQKLAMS